MTRRTPPVIDFDRVAVYHPPWETAINDLTTRVETLEASLDEFFAHLVRDGAGNTVRDRFGEPLWSGAA